MNLVELPESYYRDFSWRFRSREGHAKLAPAETKSRAKVQIPRAPQFPTGGAAATPAKRTDMRSAQKAQAASTPPTAGTTSERQACSFPPDQLYEEGRRDVSFAAKLANFNRFATFSGTSAFKSMCVSVGAECFTRPK